MLGRAAVPSATRETAAAINDEIAATAQAVLRRYGRSDRPRHRRVRWERHGAGRVGGSGRPVAIAVLRTGQ